MDSKDIVKNDYSNLIQAASSILLNIFLPPLGAIHSAASSLKIEERLQILENSMKEYGIDMQKLKEFIGTDNGYSFFIEMLQNTIKANSKEKVRIYTRILSDSYNSDSQINIQYGHLVMKTVSELTELELRILAYWVEFYKKKEDNNFQRECIRGDFYMPVYAYLRSQRYEGVSFLDYLSNKNVAKVILENIPFFFLRFENLGIAQVNSGWNRVHYVTKFGEQVLQYLNSESNNNILK